MGEGGNALRQRRIPSIAWHRFEVVGEDLFGKELHRAYAAEKRNVGVPSSRFDMSMGSPRFTTAGSTW